MARGLSPATKLARRRLWVWQASNANASNPFATDRVSDGDAEIQRQAQATDSKSLAPADKGTADQAVAAAGISMPSAGRLMGDTSSNQKQAEPLADRTADGSYRRQQAGDASQAQQQPAQDSAARAEDHRTVRATIQRAADPYARSMSMAGMPVSGPHLHALNTRFSNSRINQSTAVYIPYRSNK